MKKLLLGLILVLFVGTSFAYTPTVQDEELVVKFTNLFEMVIDSGRKSLDECTMFLNLVSVKTNNQKYKYVLSEVSSNLEGNESDEEGNGSGEVTGDENLDLNFVFAGKVFYKNSEKVIYRQELINSTNDFDLVGLDSQSFVYITKNHHFSWYVKDKNGVYLISDIRGPGGHIDIIPVMGISDMDSFVIAETELTPKFFKDNDFVYYKISASNSGELGRLDILDSDSFESFGADGMWRKIKDKFGIYNFSHGIIFINVLDKTGIEYYGYGDNVRKILFPDIESVISGGYGLCVRNYCTDGEKLYYDDNFIPGISGNGFEIIAGTNAQKYLAKNIYNILALDAIGGVQIVEGADVDTFMLFSGTNYSKDINNGYWSSMFRTYTVIKGIDYETFEPVEIDENICDGFNSFAKDKSDLYYAGMKLSEVDPNTFDLLYKDGNLCYFKDFLHTYSISSYDRSFEIVD